MNPPHYNFPALIRSLAILQPEDLITCEKIMKILGMEKTTLHRSASHSKRPTNLSRDSVEQSVGPLSGNRKVPTQKVGRKEIQRKPILSDLTRIDHPESQPPDWLNTVNQLAEPSQANRLVKVPLEPLLRPDWTRHILSGALATWSAQGPLNLQSLVETTAQGKKLFSLPRLRHPSLSHGIQVLIDLNLSMEPFYLDQLFLEQQILKVIGTDRTQVFLFSGLPEWGIKEVVVDDWTYYRNPPVGTPVLLLTDLGIGCASPGTERVSQADWVRFSKKLSKNESSVVALVPYSLKRIPTILKKAMRVVSWDRTTTILSLKKSLNFRISASSGQTTW